MYANDGPFTLAPGAHVWIAFSAHGTRPQHTPVFAGGYVKPTAHDTKRNTIGGRCHCASIADKPESAQCGEQKAAPESMRFPHHEHENVSGGSGMTNHKGKKCPKVPGFLIYRPVQVDAVDSRAVLDAPRVQTIPHSRL